MYDSFFKLTKVHELQVTFAPEDAERGGPVLAFDGRVRFEAGRIVLVRSEGDTLVAR